MSKNKFSYKKTMDQAQTIRKCKHCRSDFVGGESDLFFCCPGCQAAHSMISAMRLEDFYQLAENSQLAKGSLFDDQLVEVFDEEEFSKQFCERYEDQIVAKLHISGLTCYACIWLIRKAFEKKAPEARIDISLSSGEARLVYNQHQYNLSTLIRLIASLGYPVKPMLGKGEKGNAGDLIRIGVSTFCFLNIMMFALPDYVDINFINQRSFWQLFRWISFALASIIMSYSAFPFFKSSWNYLRRLRLTVDQPIVLALIIVFIYSGFNTIKGDGEIYFDSIAIIVTLLLTGRYFQKTIVQKAEIQVRGRFDLSMHYVKQEVKEKKKIIPVHKLAKDDEFYVLPGDPVPVDALILKGHGEINYEQITGEAVPEEVHAGKIIRAGAVTMNHRLDLKSLEDGSTGLFARMDQLLSRMLLEQGIYTKFSDRLASLFFAFILLFATSLLILIWPSSPTEAIRRTVAALLVACPCAFAIAVPLTMTKATAIALGKGIIFKSQRAIESLAQAKKIFFDKTGTLTYGHPKIEHVIWHEDINEALSISETDLLKIFQVLSSYSSHHMSLALSNWAREQMSMKQAESSVNSADDSSEKKMTASSRMSMISIAESIGQGLTISAKDLELRLGRLAFAAPEQKERVNESHKSIVYLGVRGKILAEFLLTDIILPEAGAIISELKQMGMIPGIISGDRESVSLSVAQSLGIDNAQVLSEATPFDKVKSMSESMSKKNITVMVGNGINDSLALAGSDVGIAVGTASQKAKDSAAICLLGEGLSNLLPAVTVSKLALKKIRTCFIFTSFYNLIGLSLAAFGKINPAFAAALMPLSSITVVVIATHWRGKVAKVEWQLQSLPET